MVKPEFYIEQYPRLVTVIDETITQLDALPLDYVRYEYLRTILRLSLIHISEPTRPY